MTLCKNKMQSILHLMVKFILKSLMKIWRKITYKEGLESVLRKGGVPYCGGFRLILNFIFLHVAVNNFKINLTSRRGIGGILSMPDFKHFGQMYKELCHQDLKSATIGTPPLQPRFRVLVLYSIFLNIPINILKIKFIIRRAIECISSMPNFKIFRRIEKKLCYQGP